MLRKIISAIILIPLAVIIIGFAVANRQVVTVSFDPFDATQPALSLTLPLFAMVFVLVILGVIIGGIAAWLRQGHWRRSARRLDHEVRGLRAETAAMREKLAAQSNAQNSPQNSPQDTAPLQPTPPLIAPPPGV
jgi:uncharacterized integral membrane protein